MAARKQEALSFEDLGNHVRDCEHRVVRCPYAGCVKTMPLMDLMKHLSTRCCMFIKDCEENGRGSHLFYVNNFFNDRNWKIGIFKYRGLQVFNANMYQINPNLILLSFELNLYLHCIRMV